MLFIKKFKLFFVFVLQFLLRTFIYNKFSFVVKLLTLIFQKIN